MRKTFELKVSYKQDLEREHLVKFNSKLSKDFGVSILRTLIVVKAEPTEENQEEVPSIVLLDLKNKDI